jgi:hypothetical protein
MELLAGKSASEKKKILAAALLGLVALIALYIAFGSSLFSGSKAAPISATPTPTRSGSTSSKSNSTQMPSQADINLVGATTEIKYQPSDYQTREPGRNIFAFHEKPPCYPNCPTPTPVPTPVKTPTPTPTPPMRLQYVTPQTVYAGAGSFRLEANGDRFDPSARLYFNQTELPTQFVSPQKLVANVPSTLIAAEGSKQVIAQTPDGKLYSDQMMINVQPPPKPQFTYIGMIARARHNNDTAYFIDPSKPAPAGSQPIPIGARLNDVVGGRFRLISISSAETVFEDVNLGFKHRLKLSTNPQGTATGSPPNRGFPDGNIYQQGYPNVQNIPGIPNNIPRGNPQQIQRPPQPKKDEDDDDGDGNP